MSKPTPGPATGAMRLRPASSRDRATEASPRAGDDTSRDEALDELLDELLELHTSAGVVPLCRECLTADPCRTRQLAERIAGTRTPSEEGSQ